MSVLRSCRSSGGFGDSERNPERNAAESAEKNPERNPGRNSEKSALLSLPIVNLVERKGIQKGIQVDFLKRPLYRH